MSTSATTITRPRSMKKIGLWTVLFFMALSVLVLSEIPILRPAHPLHAHFASMRLLLPHALAGTLAILIGPLQFSTRLRQRNLQLHRVLGRVYVYSVFIAAPLAIIIAWRSPLIVGTITQAGAWFVTTLAALLTARNRQLQAHRQWMIRSYAVTFTFVSLRVLNPWPAYTKIPDPQYVPVIIIVTMLSVFLPDIAFNWRELTTRRA
jgi:uncharacterized membrane protein